MDPRISNNSDYFAVSDSEILTGFHFGILFAFTKDDERP
jgi:hypothetical protein